MTISSSEIRRNMTIVMDGDIYQILDWQHRQAPKAPPTLTLKVRQLKSGNVYERKLPGNQKLTPARTERRSLQYLYANGDMYTFMDNNSFEQFDLNKEFLQESLKFLEEGDSTDMLFHNNFPLVVELPSTVTLLISQTEIGLRGDTQSGATKPAKASTGLTMQVPLFVNEGDSVIVNSSTGEYTGRAE